MVSGSGTQNDPYILSSFTDLELIGTSPYTVDKWFKLGADIDASPTQDPSYNSGAGWLPRGAFTGGFDGDGKTITGLYINRPSTDNIGLFSTISTNNIKNVTLSNVNITGRDYVGALFGAGGEANTVTGISVTGGVNGRNYVGGVLGNFGQQNNLGGSITYCNCSANITASGNYVGGIAGRIMRYTVDNCNYNGVITGVGYIGGVIGEYGWNEPTLSNCTAQGSITATGERVGGIVGNQGHTAIYSNCSVTNMVITGGASSHRVGGFLGCSQNHDFNEATTLNTLTNITIEAEITGHSYVGGFLGEGRVMRLVSGGFNGEINAVTGVGFVAGLFGVNNRILDGTNVTLEGTLTATGTNIGAVVGQCYHTLRIQNYNISRDDVTINPAATSDSVGGILGYYGELNFPNGFIEDCSVDYDLTGRDYIGGILGYGNLINVRRCEYKGDLSGRNYLGGISGRQGWNDPEIINCSVDGTVTGTGSYIGGYVGVVGHRLTLKNLTNTDVTVTASSTSDYVGGILGGGGDARVTMENCHAVQDITGRDQVGGLAGQLVTPLFTDSTAQDITVTGRSNIGGAIGHAPNGGTITNCHAKNITINSTGQHNGGLFGYLAHPIMSDCTVETINITNGTGKAGGLIGFYEYGNSLTNITARNITITGPGTANLYGGMIGEIWPITTSYAASLTNCRIYGVKITGGQDYVGGLCGATNRASLTRCSAEGVDISGRIYVGGLIGSLSGGVGTVTLCYSKGTVNGTGTYHGGLIGINAESTVVNNSFSHCTVNGNDHVGGFIGRIAGGNLLRNYSKGAVTGNSNVGGFNGSRSASQTANDCFWDTQTSGQANSNLGTGKTTAEMKLEETYTNWDFNTPVWAIDTAWNDGYPFLAGYGIPMYLSGTIEANSTVQGDLTVTSPYTRLSGEVTGESSLSGDLRVWKKVEMPGGEVAGESSLEGNLRLLTLEPLAGEMEGSSELEGDLSFRKSAAKLSDELTLAVLGPDESLLRFLNPEVLEVEETNILGGVRVIEVIHNLLDDQGLSLGEYADLLVHGNKIWRQFTSDGDSCLYILNDDREVDPEENQIKVTAEEVSAELSNLPPVRFNMTAPVEITGAWLESYVGDLFTAGEITPGQYFSYSGTIGVMGLLREIEEQTGFEFSFRYEFNTTQGVIERFLDFQEERGTSHSVPVEIGYNTANILLEENEGDVAIAAAPLGSPSDSKDEANTAFHQARKAFEDLVVNPSVQIPLWVTKDEEGNPQNGPLSYPPYPKGAGDTYVASDGSESGAEYKEITKKAGLEGVIPRTVLFESSEENPYNLYWLCVKKIREKQQPAVKLETVMINIGRMSGYDPTVYNVGDTVALDLPGRSSRVMARIQKTVKDPRSFDKDKIELGNFQIDFFEDYLDIGSSGRSPYEDL